MKYIKWIVCKVMSWFPWYGEPGDIVRKQEKKDEKKKPKTEKEQSVWNTISGLRKNVDIVFSELSFIDYIGKDGYSHNSHKSTIKGLRALGPFMMPMLCDVEEMSAPFMQAKGREAPAIAFLGFPWKKEVIENKDKEERLLYPRFLYALRMDKSQISPYVEFTGKDEVIYECGGAVYDDAPPRWARRYKKKLNWFCYWYAFNRKTGKSRVLKIKEYRNNKFYTQQLFKRPPSDIRDDTLQFIMNVWVQRDFYWQVVAESDKQKATFCIEQNRAKEYFKDRYIDDDGKRKRIFHWVKSHYRHTKTAGIVPVKTHFRGNRKFTWGKYSITIRVPGMHSLMLSGVGLEASYHDTKEKGKISLKKAVRGLDQELMTR